LFTLPIALCHESNAKRPLIAQAADAMADEFDLLESSSSALRNWTPSKRHLKRPEKQQQKIGSGRKNKFQLINRADN